MMKKFLTWLLIMVMALGLITGCGPNQNKPAADPEKDQTTQEETKKDEPKQEEKKQDESKKDEPEKEEPKQEETKQEEKNQGETAQVTKPEKKETTVDGITDMPGAESIELPYVVADSEDELEQQLGFGLTVKDPKEYVAKGFLAYVKDEKMAEISYLFSERDEAGKQYRLIIRKAPGTNDISGDDSAYNMVETKKKTITLKGYEETGLFYQANWTKDDYSYSVHSDAGMKKHEMMRFISKIK